MLDCVTGSRDCQSAQLANGRQEDKDFQGTAQAHGRQQDKYFQAQH